MSELPLVSSKKVKRFSGYGISMLSERPDAGYVLGRDYDALQANHDRLREVLESIREKTDARTGLTTDRLASYINTLAVQALGFETADTPDLAHILDLLAWAHSKLRAFGVHTGKPESAMRMDAIELELRSHSRGESETDAPRCPDPAPQSLQGERGPPYCAKCGEQLTEDGRHQPDTLEPLV